MAVSGRRSRRAVHRQGSNGARPHGHGGSLHGHSRQAGARHWPEQSSYRCYARPTSSCTRFLSIYLASLPDPPTPSPPQTALLRTRGILAAWAGRTDQKRPPAEPGRAPGQRVGARSGAPRCREPVEEEEQRSHEKRKSRPVPQSTPSDPRDLRKPVDAAVPLRRCSWLS